MISSVSWQLFAGGIVVAVAAIAAGASGFGLGLLTTPSLLLVGFSLRLVVTISLLMTLATRISVAYRFQHAIRWRRTLTLVAASVPGLVVGIAVLRVVSGSTIKALAGVIVMEAAVALGGSARRKVACADTWSDDSSRLYRWCAGTTTSLIAVPPVL
jgi:uncharacterized membrane protein YfcA